MRDKKMERVRQKRSHGREISCRGFAAKIRNGSDQKSGDNLGLTEKVLVEGNRLNRKPIDTFKDTSDSSSCSSGSTDENPFVFELRRNSLKQVSRTPMKKISLEELSKEMESRRDPPSIIARLMGLDPPLPPQQHIHQQQKRFSENYLQRTASIALQKSPFYESRSFRMCKKEEKEFKDVFEVLQTPKAEKQSNPLVRKGTANFKPIDAKMTFIQQKFMDAKRLSTDEKLQHSKEFHDALEVFDSNKDLLLKFLQEPDSLFTKHLHNLHGASPPHQSCHKAALKSSNAMQYEKSDLCWKSEHKTKQRDVRNSLQQHDSDRASHCHSRHGAYESYKSKSQYEEKDETCFPLTRIVVLKPNLGKAHNTSRTGFGSGCGKRSELQSSKNRELFAEVRDWKNSLKNVEFMRHHRSKSPREIAKEITVQMSHSVSSSSVKASSLGLRGYAGDESSYSVSENDSANEYDIMKPTSRYALNLENRYSHSLSYSNSTKSSVSREAKKRLSEQWKMTHRFQELGLVGRGSTLGEMLAMPDIEMRPTLDSGVRLASSDGVARWVSPLGISSRDGWKDGCSRNLPRSRSVPASSTAFVNPQASIRHGALGNDKCLMPKEVINLGTNRSRRGNVHSKEDSLLRNLTSRSKKFQCSPGTDRENSHVVKATHLSLVELRNNIEEMDQAEPLACDVAYDRLVVEEGAVAEADDVARSSEIPGEPPSESTDCILLVKSEDSSTHDPNDSMPKEETYGLPEEGALSSHCPLPEPESPVRSKEADQPSPVSVLEPPFVEDMSSGSECFERVSADLHELRMQVQLLKLESSDACTDKLGMIVSSDEDPGGGSIGRLDEKGEPTGLFKSEENRDHSYLVDMFVDSGFLGVDQEIVLAALYLPECPVDPMVFDKLEKKYGEQLTWPKSERKLLFDRINNGLMEILRPSMDLYPWVKLVRTRAAIGWCKEALMEELWKLLVSEGKEGNSESSEKWFGGREMRWLELGEDIDVVGREIEKLLLDELIAEVVCV